MVAQSIKCAMVIVSSIVGPPHSWGALLREGSFSLNPHQNHWMHHQNCSSQIGLINGDSSVLSVLMF